MRMASQMGNVDLVATAEVVRILRISNSTVMRMVESGQLTPAYKAPGLRGAYLFNKSDISALAEGESK